MFGAVRKSCFIFFFFFIRLEEQIKKIDKLCLLRRKETECCVQQCRDLLKPWWVSSPRKIVPWLFKERIRCIGWSTFHLLDSDLSTGLSYPLFEQLGSDVEA